MKNSKVEIIDNSQETSCYTCDGKGSIIENNIPGVVCKTCNGTGKYKQDNYLLIATQPNGIKSAFNADQGGK